MIRTETIDWHPLATEGPPDSDIAVLMTLEGDSEPTWPGWWDGERWIDATTAAPVGSIVTAWSHMPKGYGR